MTGKKKVAVLGGGIAGLTTALELTATAELRGRYEVTVHQMGWRPGGKCASGRDPAHADRIEEHGIHFWYGSYDNGFTMLRDVFAELDRPESCPIRDLRSAFRPLSSGALCDVYEGDWTVTEFPVPMNSSMPGDDVPIPTFWDLVLMVLDSFGKSRPEVQDKIATTWATSGKRHDRSITALFERGAAKAASAADRSAMAVVRSYVSLRRRFGADHHRILPKALDVLRNRSWGRAAHHLDDDGIRHRATMIDLNLTLLAGMLRDGMIVDGFGVADDMDFRAWLQHHGAQDLTLRSPWVRAQYDQVFSQKLGPTVLDLDAGRVTGYGEHDSAAIAAGVAVSTYLRQFILERGAVLWRMNAGMGDVVIAPIYELLVRRGVQFEFFHRVDAIERSDDGSDIDTITVGVQAETTGADGYDPLIDVGGLPCFPSAPKWEALERGDDLRRSHVDFEMGEDDPAVPADRRTAVLTRGEDFDIAVLAISAAALPRICRDLLADEQRPAFREMLAHTHTCMTQGVQLWMTRSLSELGWSAGSTVVSTFLEPLDTYSDMSHLVDVETWSADDRVRSVAYFCGVLEDRHDDDVTAARQRVRHQVGELLDKIHTLWPNAIDGGGFRWEYLVAPADAHDEDRLEQQYWRANIAPSERYVQTPPGTVRYRLAADESGWPSLVLAGDWTRTGMNIGCVEATVMSGKAAARSISGSPSQIAWESADWLLYT